MENEELIYNVRYGFIDLGQIRIRTWAKEESSNFVAYRGKANIDSYRKVPFVDLHAIYESLIDSAVYSREFVGRAKDGKVWNFSRYKYESDKGRLLMEAGSRDTTTVERRDTMYVKSPIQDGLSLFFYARRYLYNSKPMNVPVVITEKKVNTYINFKNERSSVEIDGFDYPIDVIGFDGTAEFVGIFGLTGDFEGWFSNDEARIPIMAKMKVIIGSVTIELMEAKRSGWKPPRGN